MRTTKPTFEEFGSYGAKYIIAMKEYCEHLEITNKRLEERVNELEWISPLPTPPSENGE